MIQRAGVQPSLTIKMIIGYFYFVQGIVLSFASTIPFTYKQLPSYAILSYFSAALLPFSFKFITVSYGRRKFWIITSMALCSALCLVLSTIVNDSNKQIETAIVLFFIVLSLSIQDINVDALGVKQLKDPELSSFLTSVYQPIGFVIGILTLGEMTTEGFGKAIGFSGAVLSSKQIILFVAGVIGLPTFWIHFSFRETCTYGIISGVQKEKTVKLLPLWSVIKHYKYFFLPKYRYCRQAIFILTLFQGTNFFTAGYSVELIKNSILTKQFIVNLNTFPSLAYLPLIYLLRKFVGKRNSNSFEKILLISRLSASAIIYFSDFRAPSFVTASLLVIGAISSVHFYVQGITALSFQNSKFEAMAVTMMASLCNLGRNTSLHLNLIGHFGFENCVFYSFVYTALFLVFWNSFNEWIAQGAEEDEGQPNLKND